MNIALNSIFAYSVSGDHIISFMMFLIVLFAFLATWAFNRLSILRIRKSVKQSQELSAIMQRTLDISHNYVLKLDLKAQHATNLHGNLLPEEGMGYQESFELIHPDDRQTYRDFIMRLYKGGMTTDSCVFRWDVSGAKHLGTWRYMHDQGVVEYGNSANKLPTVLFCTLTDQTEKIELEHKEQELSNKYRMMFEQNIVGLAFYDKEGRLLTTNNKMRQILKFQSEDDPYYFGHTLYEMPTFRELLVSRQAEELYFCTKSVIIERSVNLYTEMRLHPILNDSGELTYITLSIRDVTQERELYLQNKRNEMEIKQANQAIQQYETELQYLMDTCNMIFFRTSLKDQVCTFFKNMSTPEKQLTFTELIHHFINSPFQYGLMNYENYFSVPRKDLSLMHPFFHEGEELQWNFIDSVPYFDADGKMAGTYGIVRNVDELIKKQEKLKQETERANDSGRQKAVFMANMTHEIRTPLNSIVGFSDVLPMLSTPEEKQEIVRVIMNNCDMLLRLINDILAVSTLDAGGIRVDVQEVDFSKSFDDICETLAQRVQQPSVEFIKDNPYKSFLTRVDNGHIQQVITNFVTNAVKYTHQGHIKAGYRYQDGGLYVYCEDTGEGIPKEHQGKIFDRFVKLNDYIQGTGLGLSICKAIANSNNGKIGVISEGKGHGCTFWLWIPCEELKIEKKEE